MNEEVTLKSGRKLQLQIATFTVSMRLFKTIANELKVVDIKIDGLSMEKIKTTDVMVLKNAVLQLLGSDTLETAIRECMKCCLYDNQKIGPATFEPQDARRDYLECAWEVIKFNLSPFFGSLDFASLTAASPPEKSPASP